MEKREKYYICSKKELRKHYRDMAVSGERPISIADTQMAADRIICVGKINEDMQQELLLARCLNMPVDFVTEQEFSSKYISALSEPKIKQEQQMSMNRGLEMNMD